jgi:type I restriction enzyme S subunit
MTNTSTLAFQLGDVLTNIRTGLNPRVNFKLNTLESSNYYITVRELGGFGITPTPKTDLVDDEALQVIQNRSKLQVGDVLFSGTGTIGRTALIEQSPTNWNIKEGVYALTPDTNFLNPKYLIYVLGSSAVKQEIASKTDGSTVSSISMASLKSIKLELPSLERQLEIVEILDTFRNLDAKLEAELEARKKQALVYSQSILNFEGHKDVVRAQLGNVCRTFSGDFVKKTKQDDNFLFPVFNGGSSHTGFYNESNSPADSITISARGSIGTVNWVGVPFWAGNSCHVVSPDSSKLNNRYLYHYLKHNEPALKRLKAVGTIPALNLKPLLGFEIPIPSLDAQADIVNKLDLFDALINDLSNGLPAELAARRKQYDYYRNNLLTFKDS